MAERPTAEAQLARVLELLPRAARDGGVALAELAAELGMEARAVLADLQAVYTRAYYHPAGSADDVQVLIEADQVEVWTTGEFRRPPRLTPREALALGLGLRVLAAEQPEPARPALLALAERLERGLADGAPEELRAGIAVGPGADSPEGIRAALHAAARARRRCAIAYLKSGAAAPEPRRVDPYVLLAAQGVWYLVGFCHRNRNVRVFRADRVVRVETLEEGFSLPADFDPHAYVTDGRVFLSTEDVEVTVRYSARIARWIEEQGPVDPQPDGSVVVRHRVADPTWLVRHVLQHGPDAEVVAPPEMRERVARALSRLTGAAAIARPPSASGPTPPPPDPPAPDAPPSPGPAVAG